VPWVIASISLLLLGIVLGAGILAYLAGIFRVGPDTTEPWTATVVDSPPPVQNKDQIKAKYDGHTIVYFRDQTGLGQELDDRLANQFTADTGIKVIPVSRPIRSDENFSLYQRNLERGDPGIDVYMLDVTMPAAFATHFIDLSIPFAKEIAQYDDRLITNNTINNRIVGIPYFVNYGVLFYNEDLLKKHGFNTPPTTWNELEHMAKVIQANERQVGQADVWGYVWQGAEYEGLTCNALEWMASSGEIIDNDWQFTLNTPQAQAALNRASGWIGTISPEEVLTYQEDESVDRFAEGKTAFLRHWPGAYATLKDKANFTFAVAPLPGEQDKHFGTLGGWQLAVSEYSKEKDAAIEFVRYMTSPDVQKYRAIFGSFNPTIPAVARDPQVNQTTLQYLPKIDDIELVPRPSRATKDNYNDASKVFFQGIHGALISKGATQTTP
jgi:trehalose/maltose transport system substrate-binding protein